MKKGIGFLLFLLATIATYSQTVVGSNFALKSTFVKINNETDQIYKIGLGTIKSEAENGTVLFIHHTVNDFSISKTDTAGLTMLITPYMLRSHESATWMELDKIMLKRTILQPQTNANSVIISFYLPDSLAFDLKGQLISQIKLINTQYKNGTRSVMTEEVNAYEPGKSFFKTYAGLILAKKGSFDNIDKYKLTPIKLYSLMEKSPAFVAEKIGEPLKMEEKKSELKIATYETADAIYTIEFRKDISEDIVCVPKSRFKYTNQMFVINKYPFEIINCNCGEYTSKNSSSPGGDATYSIINTFRDEHQHKIEFFQKGRFLEKVNVRVY